ncbi:hypothetical protein [Liquorilactobacillus hordei]|uniref:hypothetical protein n=1 Tax=Liquorilactobacillus hordei TaxID=468911 RepID=UPI0039E8D716
MRVFKIKGEKAHLVRVYKVGGVSYADFVKLSNGEQIKGVKVVREKTKNERPVEKEQAKVEEVVQETVEEVKPKEDGYVEEEAKEPSQQIVVTSKDSQATFDYPSAEFDKFVEDNKLNPVMVDNCIEGKQKTHKGYEFKLED